MVRIDVHPQGTIEENLEDLKKRQGISKETLEEAVRILTECLEKY